MKQTAIHFILVWVALWFGVKSHADSVAMTPPSLLLSLPPFIPPSPAPDVANNLQQFSLQTYSESGDLNISIKAESAYMDENFVLHMVKPHITDLHNNLEFKSQAGEYNLEQDMLELTGAVTTTVKW